MTALAASPGIPDCRNTQTKIMSEKTIATGSVLYVGGIICVDTSNNLVPASDSTAIRFEGIFWPWSGQNMTGDGTLKGRCFTGCEVLLPCAGTVAASQRLAPIYAADDAGVTNVNTLGPQIGILIEMETSTSCWVRLSAPAMTDAS